MHTSGSLCLTVVEMVRAYLDDSDLAAKYSDSDVIRLAMAPAMRDVMSRLALAQDNPVLHRMVLPVEEGQEYYQLPPCVQGVWRLGVFSDEGLVVWESKPNNEFHPWGPGWALEGNMLVLRPIPASTPGETLHVLYQSSGDMMPFYVADAAEVAMDGVTVDLGAATGLLGLKDRRPNAYVGAVLRVLADDAWQERLITAHDPTANGGQGSVTVRLPFDPDLAGEDELTIEVVPPAAGGVWEAICVASAIKLSTFKQVPATKAAALMLEYKKAMKTAKDLVGNMLVRQGQASDRRTVDNKDIGAVWAPLEMPLP